MEKQIGMAYARVSTEEQAEYSPMAQIEDILEYARKNNIFIPNEYIFIDEGISGKSANNRPAFLEMIKKARKKTNNISVILVHKFDRFSRKKDDQVLYKALLKKDGVKVISVKEPIPEDDKFAVIYESMLEAMSEYYSLNLAEEVKKTMVKKAERGECQSIAPFGYKNENKTLAVVPEEAEIVKMIFEKYLNDTPMLKIAQTLNDMGIRTHRGNVFENRTIQYIINNPVYIGCIRWTPTGKIKRDFYNKDTLVVKGTHDPIISEEVFKKATEKWKMQRQKSTPHQRPVSEGKHWLSSLVKCSACGRSLIISHRLKDGNFSMQCGGYNHGQCKVSHYIKSQDIIPVFLEELKNLANNSDSLNSKIEFIKLNKDNDSKINETLLQKSKSRLAKAKEAYLNGVDTLEEYKINKSILEKEILSLEKKLSEQKKVISPLNDKGYLKKINNLCDLLQNPNASMENKKKSTRELVEKIVYNKSDNTLKLFLYV